MKILIPLFFIIIFLSFPLVVNAQICEIYTGIPEADLGPSALKLIEIINKIAWLLVLIGVGAGILVVIIGGIKYMTAGGDESKTGDARKFITYGILGFIIVVAAQFIICFVAEILENLYI